MPIGFHIFHQNLRVFGGSSLIRNQVFDDALGAISGKLGRSNRVLVCGFTEVVNAGTKNSEAITSMSLNLDPDLKQTYFFACGVTALKNVDKPEYIAISTFKDSVMEFKAEAMGKVLKSSSKGWTCYSSKDCDLKVLPKDDLEADIRGLAYIYGRIVGGEYEGNPMLVGFMHNMYNLGDRSSYFTSLASIVDQICSKHSIAKYPVCIVGGDFNLEPREVSLRSGFSLTPVFQQDRSGTAVKTTSKNTYDYWLTHPSDYADSRMARVWADTRDVKSKLSDHGAISLKLPLK